MSLYRSRLSMAVVGSLLGVATVSFIIFCFKRRRAKKDNGTRVTDRLPGCVEDKSSSCTGRSQKQKRLSPNYFVAIPVTNMKIHQKVEEIQQSFLKRNRLFRHLFVPLPTLHLTVMVMHIADEEQLNVAKAALDACRGDIVNSGVGRLLLTVSGVGHFNESVLFATIADDAERERLFNIADTVWSVFTHHGLSVTKESDFKPHITILKMSKAPWLRKKGIKKINPLLYADFTDAYMGLENVTRLQLCAMSKSKDKVTGYYHVDHEVHLSNE